MALNNGFRYHVTVEIEPGTMLGGYQILSHLTKGGMGSLYIARKAGPGGFARDVVLKVVHRELSLDDEFVRLFLQEARLSVAIRHPNVVHVEDLGQEGHTYFIVMELFEGVSLSRILKKMRREKQPFPIAIAVYIARCLADGMHAAHETTDRQGHGLEIVHRDATPHNVLVGRTGQVKLIDFGIAKARTATVYTQKGMVRGKIAYLAPEQVWGRAIDRRTDIYTLGAVIYEMLAGRRLVESANQAELFAKIREPDHAPVRTWRPELPRELDEVVMRALAPNPDQRYETARAMRDALMDAYPAAARTDAEDLAPIVQQMANKELGAIQRVIQTSAETATAAPTASGELPGQGQHLNGAPSKPPPQRHLPKRTLPGTPGSAPPAKYTPTPANSSPELTGTDARLLAAGISPRSSDRPGEDLTRPLAPATAAIPLVVPRPPPVGPEVDEEAGSAPRFSMEVINEERGGNQPRPSTNRRGLIIAAIVTPFIGAAMVLGALAAFGLLR